MARKIPEWVEPDHDKRIPDEVQRRIIKRSDGKCVDCGRVFDAKLKPQMDHRPPLWELAGPQRESLIFAACMACHKGTTKEFARERRDTKRAEKKKWGLQPKPKNQGRLSTWRAMDGTIRWTGWRRGAPPPTWLRRDDGE